LRQTAIIRSRNKRAARRKFAEVEMTTCNELENLSWPISRLGDAMRIVAHHCTLFANDRGREKEMSGPPAAPGPDQPIALVALNEWVEMAADFWGFEAEAIDAPYAEVEILVRGMGPGLLRLPGGGILAVIKSGTRRATIIDADLKLHRV